MSRIRDDYDKSFRARFRRYVSGEEELPEVDYMPLFEKQIADERAEDEKATEHYLVPPLKDPMEEAKLYAEYSGIKWFRRLYQVMAVLLCVAICGVLIYNKRYTMDTLEKTLGYSFRDPAMLELALTHSSYANERGNGRAGCNERLEFLGDSILGYLSAECLYCAYPDKPEGEMTKLRSELVCEQSLARVAGKLGLGKHLRLGRGEELNGGRTRPSINADAAEAGMICGGEVES